MGWCWTRKETLNTTLTERRSSSKDRQRRTLGWKAAWKVKRIKIDRRGQSYLPGLNREAISTSSLHVGRASLQKPDLGSIKRTVLPSDLDATRFRFNFHGGSWRFHNTKAVDLLLLVADSRCIQSPSATEMLPYVYDPNAVNLP